MRKFLMLGLILMTAFLVVSIGETCQDARDKKRMLENNKPGNEDILKKIEEATTRKD